MNAVIEKHELNSELIQSFPNYLIKKIFGNLSEGILITGIDKRIVLVNPAFEVVTGYKLEEVTGHTPAVIQSGIHPKQFYIDMWEEIRVKGFWEGEIWNRRKTGDIYPEWLSIFPVKNDVGEITNYCGIFTDLSNQKLIEKELKNKVVFDHLTHINNRHAYIERLQLLLDKSAPHNKHAVFFLNLDRFKQVNDTLGHLKGDLLLVEVANRIKSLLRNKDILARYGGDEFVFTLTNIKSPREAAIFAEQVIKKIEEPIFLDEQELFVSTSVGISIYPEDGVTVEQLINRADKAMSYSKANDQTGFSFYFDDLNTDTKRVLIMDQELRKAIDQKDFELYYQPKVDIHTLEIIGVEALVRWQNDKLGFVPPSEFIQYAEDTGLIIPISEIIFEEACKGYMQLAQAGYGHLSIAINVSSIHFQQQSFLDSIKKILERNNTSAQHFEIEVTERTVMNKAKETVSKLVRLKQLGFKLSIDDFGTGYSSLSYLVRFPLDVLKIDRSFIQHITSLDEKQAIVDAIIQMSHRLNMQVVAEGVESAQQAALLQQLGCDYVQGYYYSKPIPMDELLELLPYWEYEHQGRN